MEITVKEINYSTGDKKPTTIVTMDDSKMSGFDSGLKDVNVGDRLDVEIKPKGQWLNIISFTILEKGSAAPAPVATTSKTNGDRSGMTPDLWAEKDRIERASFEAQTAFKGIITLVAGHPPELVLSDSIKESLEKALKWADGKLDANMSATLAASIEQLAGKKPADKPEPGGDESLFFKSFGDLLTLCLRDYGVQRSQVLEWLGMDEKSDFAKLNLEEAWMVISEKLPAKKEAV